MPSAEYSLSVSCVRKIESSANGSDSGSASRMMNGLLGVQQSRASIGAARMLVIGSSGSSERRVVNRSARERCASRR
jgi:hypothetical protein